MLNTSYLKLPERFYQRIHPEHFSDPKLVLFNESLAKHLGLNFSDKSELAEFFSGQKLLPGSDPIAQVYAGSQFGHFVPQLGDGRAHLLGDVKGLDIQLKGSGRTRFSRRGDGRSALGPVIREFLVSEAMHVLGVPTTRALSIVTTGEHVLRQDGPEPGAILTRIADSHLRVGTFQYFAAQGDYDALAALTDYAIERHYPEIRNQHLSERCLRLLKSVAERQGDLVAQWYGLGFIHGVMNTDNCSIAGITIDYGPCAFLDEFNFQKVFSSIDVRGRYAYGNQMSIAKWNVLKLTESLAPLIDEDKEVAYSKIQKVLSEIFSSYSSRVFRTYGLKLGLSELSDEAEALVRGFLTYLEDHELDFTLSFSHLENLLSGDFQGFVRNAALEGFLTRWKALRPDLSLLRQINPKLIPRSHQIQNVIDLANQGDYQALQNMWEALQDPFEVSVDHQYLLDPPKPHERVSQTFCGT